MCAYLCIYRRYVSQKASNISGAVSTVGEDDVEFIEVQLGTYFGEDDIVRLEDKYGRV